MEGGDTMEDAAARRLWREIRAMNTDISALKVRDAELAGQLLRMDESLQQLASGLSSLEAAYSRQADSTRKDIKDMTRATDRVRGALWTLGAVWTLAVGAASLSAIMGFF